MKLKNTLPIILAVLIFCVGFAWNSRAAHSNVVRQQWEYKRMYFSSPTAKREDVDSRLNELGAEGWELVTFQPNSGEIAFGLYVFKRQK